MSSPHDSRGHGSRGPCGRTDAVLALYLDGDVGGSSDAEASGFELVCTDALANHLRDCAQCQLSLQRARRLDAVLAEGAGRTMATAQTSGAIARLLTMAANHSENATAAAVTAGVGDRGSDQRVAPPAPERAIVAPTVLLLAAAGLLLLLWHRSGSNAAGPPPAAPPPRTAPAHAQTEPVAGPEPTTVATSTIPAAATPATDPAPPAGILIADDAARRLRERAAQRLAEREAAAQTESPLERSRDLTARAIEPGLPADERAAAIRELVEQSRPSAGDGAVALTRLVDTLASGRGQPELLGALLANAAAEPHFTGYLRATLRRLDSPRSSADRADVAALTVAARIGDADLDLEIRRVVRRHHELLEVVAAGLRLPLRADGTTALLLSCWSDAERRLELDDSAMAQRLFAGQPRQVFDELIEELQAARAVARRVQCLLALSHCPDRQHAAALLDWATASCRREAYVAAWSLSHLPHAWLDQAATMAAADSDAFLLRAALARAGLPAAAAWTEPMQLTERERRVLATASLAVFPQVAEWFRAGNRARSPIVDD